MEKKGILDPDGKHNNPLTNEKYSQQYKELGKVWSNLPAYEKAEEIIKTIKDNQIVLITSETGSGKTVLLPKFALHSYDYNAKIAITLPKKIIVQASAEYAAKTLDVKLGQEVGYQYRGSSSNSKSNDTRLLYATDGTIVARLLNDIELNDFDCVIIDEAHERKVQIDFLIYLLRETLKKRPEFKIIIMSATINADIFRTYFDGYKFTEMNLSGRTNYPIKSIFTNSPMTYDEALKKGFEILQKIIVEDDPSKPGAHDVLFFVTSQNEAFTTCQKLGMPITDKTKDTFCVELYSGVEAKKQDLAQHKDKYKS